LRTDKQKLWKAAQRRNEHRKQGYNQLDRGINKLKELKKIPAYVYEHEQWIISI
jgi:hypothetical protein